jgi:hypothetical protein
LKKTKGKVKKRTDIKEKYQLVLRRKVRSRNNVKRKAISFFS